MDLDLLYKGFRNSCYYEGCDEVLEELAKRYEGKDIIPYSEVVEMTDYGLPDFFWSMLVCMFGDYGIAPRRGWIDNVPAFIEFAKKVVGNLKSEA
jgi:hypothetical protein